MIEDIAAEHRKGRRLYVGTTNLDAQRLMVWNMGAIAASGHPNRSRLFRQVLLASASIPVAFPPAYIGVEVDGRRYDEMHVDGGVIAEFFLWGAMVDITKAVDEFGLDPEHRMEVSIYIIRNSQIDPAHEQVAPELVDIASRSMITILKAVAMGDLVPYLGARRTRRRRLLLHRHPSRACRNRRRHLRSARHAPPLRARPRPGPRRRAVAKRTAGVRYGAVTTQR